MITITTRSQGDVGDIGPGAHGHSRGRIAETFPCAKAALAEYFDFDPVLVRIAYAFLTVFTAFSGLIFYIVLWIVMPEKRY